MKKHILVLILASGILMSSVQDKALALPLPGNKSKAATIQDLAKTSSPEISQAEVLVEQAKAQLDLANKQVSAAKALFKAAQADLKAAETQLQALRLNAHAQGLVSETGMTPAKASPVSIASKEGVSKKESTSNGSGRIKEVDFNSTSNSEPIQLR